ncbi:MAG: DoxX family protein [bacterium]|nr:DoxX family protein [bacterium]
MDFFQTLFTPGMGNTEVWAPFVLRLGFGLGLLAHAVPKFKTFEQFSGYVASLKVPAPKLSAVFAVSIEFFGGLFFIAGLLVKPVAILVAVYFAIVIFTAHRGQKFDKGWELAYLYLVGALALWAINSSGAMALGS